MVHLLESSRLHYWVPKAPVCIGTRSSIPPYLSCTLFHSRDRPLVSFYKGSTCRQPILSLNCRPISLSVNNFNRTEAGMNFFRKKRSQKQSKNLQSILIRSALYFASKQNFLFGFLLNNWSEFDKNVLNPDDNGGKGGGFSFIPGLGGGDGDNFSRKRRKSPWKWWRVLAAVAAIFVAIFVLVVFTPILDGLIIKAGTNGLLALVLLVIVGLVALTGFILVDLLIFLMKKSKLSLARSITAGTLVSPIVLCILYPQIPKALVERSQWSIGQLKQNTNRQMKTYWKKVERVHKRVTVMLNIAIKRSSKRG